MIRVIRSMACLGVAAALAGCASSATPDVASGRYAPNVEAPSLAPAASVATNAPAAASVPAAATTNASTSTTSNISLRLLLVGDKIGIQLLGIPGGPQTIDTVIDETGNVSLPYVGALKIAGKTRTEAERIIQSAYVDGQIFPQITVIIQLPQLVYYVKGEVNRPGVFVLSSDLKFIQAFAEAGGFTEFANTKKILVIRGTKNKLYINYNELRVHPERDTPVQPGDVIDVPKRW